MITVRDASEDDVDVVTRITNDVVATTDAIWVERPFTTEERATWRAERVRAGWPVLVADVAGTVAGFASYGAFRSFPGYRATVEHSVHVSASHRGCGVGRALVEALVDRARNQELHAMVGAIDAGNTASLRFHEGLGFTRCGTLPEVGRRHGRWLDLVLVVRLVAP
jgi:phosphinothricin acetyltransferase